jgi:hypothetical protein
MAKKAKKAAKKTRGKAAAKRTSKAKATAKKPAKRAAASAGAQTAPAMKKITLDELNAMLRDWEHTPDHKIAPYLKADPNLSGPMRPVMVPNAARVAMTEYEGRRVRGAMAMNWANGAARWRREQRFTKRLKQSNDKIIVAEGDSWFQFPIALEDVIDNLNNKYNILCTSAAGDTCKRMLGGAGEYLRSIERVQSAGKKVHALLFSGGGNDFVDVLDGGKANEAPILNQYDPAQTSAPWYFQNAAFDAKKAFVRNSITEFLKLMRTQHPDIPVLLHGYDHAIPGKKQGDWRKPWWAEIDAWLAGPMGKRGISPHPLQRAIIKELIDQHNQLLQEIAASAPNAHYVDNRGLMNPHTLWADELHPTNDGFIRVAANFQTKLTQLGI